MRISVDLPAPVGPEKAEYTRPERKLYFAECLYYLPPTAIFFAEIFNYKSHAFPFH
jgi:hypothetical protein